MSRIKRLTKVVNVTIEYLKVIIVYAKANTKHLASRSNLCEKLSVDTIFDAGKSFGVKTYSYQNAAGILVNLVWGTFFSE
jgi:hypothetical protein